MMLQSRMRRKHSASPVNRKSLLSCCLIRLTHSSAMFQYNNEFFVLKSNAEIRGWTADRKKAYPTAARVAAKRAEQQALDEMRKRQREQRLLDIGQVAKEAKEARNSKAAKDFKESKENQEARAAKKAARKIKKERRKERLKRSVQHEQGKIEQSLPLLETESTAGAQPDTSPFHLPKNGNIAIQTSTDVKPSSEGDRPTDLVTVIKTASWKDDMKLGLMASSSTDESTQSAEDSDISSSDDDEKDDKDAAPDEESSKRASKIVPQAIKSKKAPIFSAPCKYYIRDGSCRRSDCRYSHDVDRTRSLTLFQRVSTMFQSYTVPLHRAITNIYIDGSK
jgi:fragile X mental retardation-interacting protein 1 (NUFIP1)